MYHPAKPGCPEMLTYEADQRHADLLIVAYGLTVSKTPWDKAVFLARHPLAGPFLDEKRRVEFRSNCMRPVYSQGDLTSATYLMLGKHPIFAAISTQTILSLQAGKLSFTELCGVLVERWG